jgi:hypothetical protein
MGAAVARGIIPIQMIIEDENYTKEQLSEIKVLQ